MKIKLLLADDQALFREGLRMVLATQPDFEVVGEATNGEEALQLASSLQPDIVLMDMRMPILGGVEATRRLRAQQPACRVIAVLRLVATGATNREIAAALYLAEGTVRNHLTNVLGKLGVSDRTQAALKARSLGLV